MREACRSGGWRRGRTSTPCDVKINEELSIPEETAIGGADPKRPRPGRTTSLCRTRCPLGEEDPDPVASYRRRLGVVSHKTEDQATASRQEANEKLGAGVRFLEYLDGRLLRSLNTDLRSLLDMADTAGIVRSDPTPSDCGGETAGVGFPDPLSGTRDLPRGVPAQ